MTDNGTKKTTIYDQWGTDAAVEQEGVVLDYGDAGWLRCRRAGGANVQYLKTIEKFGRKYRRQIELGILREDVATRELVQAYASTVVIDGELRDREGKMVKLKGNRKAVEMFFTDLPDLFRDVRDQTGSIEAFRVFDREEEAKN